MKASLLRLLLVGAPAVLLVGEMRLLFEAPFAWGSVDIVSAGLPTLFCLAFSVPGTPLAAVATREAYRRSRPGFKLIPFHVPLALFITALGVVTWNLSSAFTDPTNYPDPNDQTAIGPTSLAFFTLLGALITNLIVGGLTVVYWQSLTPKTRFDDLPMQPDATGALIAEDARRHPGASS